MYFVVKGSRGDTKSKLPAQDKRIESPNKAINHPYFASPTKDPEENAFVSWSLANKIPQKKPMSLMFKKVRKQQMVML